MFPKTVGTLLCLSLLLFGYSIFCWIRIIGRGRPDDRFRDIPKRFWNLLTIAFAQTRMLHRDFRAGLMHAVIFWGFLVITIRTFLLLGQGFIADFGTSFLTSPWGRGYSYLLNIFEALVLVAVVYALYRRLVVRPKRLTLSAEGIGILIAIALLMISDFVMEGADGGANGPLFTASYFFHITLILAFLNYLPYGKHFHILTFLPNVFFMRTTPLGQLRTLNLEEGARPDEGATSFGTGKLTDMTWKDLLDVATCTECGRCSSVCPATETGKILNPKQLNVEMRQYLKSDRSDAFVSPNLINPEVFWSCTTCRACEEACPVGIEFVDRIVGVRRHMVLTQGVMPTEVQNTFRKMETNFNPWGLASDDRAEWCKALGVKMFSDHPNAEYLYFVGCAGSFDDRNKRIATALVKILQKANIDFAILGKEELCTGDPARRIGNEYLYQTLAKQNIETMNRYKVKKVITACPHCFNTIRNEYPQFGGDYEVIHHTEFLYRLLQEGRIKAVRPVFDRIVYHDSCYLGRYNQVYDPPREILKMIPGAEVVETALSRDNGRCCGAGGGRMWMEERVGKRVNHQRLEDLQSVNPNVVASACPFCITMLRDATRDKQVEEQIRTKDVVELLAESLD